MERYGIYANMGERKKIHMMTSLDDLYLYDVAILHSTPSIPLDEASRSSIQNKNIKEIQYEVNRTC
jgi:hypothetical protein